MSDSRRSELTNPDVERIAKEAQEQRRQSAHKRDRSWDARRSKATYDVSEELKNRIKQTAESEGLRVSELACLYLEYGQQLYEKAGLEAFGVVKEVEKQVFTLNKR